MHVKCTQCWTSWLHPHFLANVEQMNKVPVFNSIKGERAEKKTMEREKLKTKSGLVGSNHLTYAHSVCHILDAEVPGWGYYYLNINTIDSGHRVQGLILEIGASSVAHQGRPRIPASQWQVNKSSDVYRDPSRCCQGPQRTLLREMTQGN